MQRSILASAVFLGAVQLSAAHALMEFPPMRGGTRGSDLNAWCPHCGNGAGVCGDGGQWGNSNFLDYRSGPVTSFVAGDTVTFTIKVTAHHKGYFEFSICDKHVDSSLADAQACLDMHKLRRAAPPADCVVNDARGDCQPIHEAHPGRWYLPPGVGTYQMRYKIPANLQCSSCTLQWLWRTANSCVPGGESTACHWAHLRSLGWNVDAWCGPAFCGTCSSSSSLIEASTAGCGEEFRNCADISVMGNAGVATTLAPSMTPTTKPEVEPETEPEKEPETEPETEPEAEREAEAEAEAGAEREAETETETQSTTMPMATTTRGVGCGTCMSCMWSDGKCYPTTKSACEGWSNNLWCGETTTVISTTMAPSKSACGSCMRCMWSDGKCYRTSQSVCEHWSDNMWCGETGTTMSTTVAPASAACGTCKSCMWSNNICYSTTKSYCESWSDNLWCGASSMAQVQRHGFLGPSLIQEGSMPSRAVMEKEL